MSALYYPPSPLLQDYVSGYVLTDYDGGGAAIVAGYPKGHATLCLSLDGTFQGSMNDDPELLQHPKFSFIPFLKSTTLFHTTSWPSRVLHVIFKPYGAFRLLQVPQHLQFGKAGTAMEDLLDKKANAFLKRMEDAGADINLIIKLLDNWLLQQVSQPKATDTNHIRLACTLIEKSNGLIRIDQLAQQVYLSKRTLEYRFQQQVGVSPKLYNRIVRFNSLLGDIRKSNTPDWQDLALKYNFFDQAHMIKEFKNFYKSTPTNPVTFRDVMGE
ncbi:AraC family transcriptional regulator [Chitinophaga sp. Cy-1792]|uniref:helix-turn-helix transcriptional regulator n=1 Tax=Chitinophaga sp. Cy-1792 TaxID=2608339 RepID=UPI0014238BBE|nr:AraC family transcriptional regulator [Chitinophaga sp. Cy-1792]NIG54267.1 helix-turn-helix transcriptional regulator [Chitinophaga sp. Cy-1792]